MESHKVLIFLGLLNDVEIVASHIGIVHKARDENQASHGRHRSFKDKLMTSVLGPRAMS